MLDESAARKARPVTKAPFHGQDVRFQELMPDILNWLGLTRIDRLVSMSDMKYDAITRQGIEVGERVAIPDERIPDDAKVEMDAKKAAGYFTDIVPSADELADAKGRALGDYEAG